MPASSLILNDILARAKQLDTKDQLTLLQKLAALIGRKEKLPEQTSGLSALAGLGSEVWKNEAAIDQYLDEERQW